MMNKYLKTKWLKLMEKHNADLLIRNFYICTMYTYVHKVGDMGNRTHTGSIHKGEFVYLIELFPRLKWVNKNDK